jgi:hypothetical protein
MTLAREYVERGCVLHPEDETCRATHNLLMSALKPLKEGDKVTSAAEQFVFDQNPGDVCYELIQAGALDPKVVLETVRMPADICWFEWPVGLEEDPRCRCGVLVCQGELVVPTKKRRTIACCFVMHSESMDPVCFGCISFPGLPFDLENDVLGFGFWKDALRMTQVSTDDDCWEEVKWFAWDVLEALFLTVTPRVCEVRQSEYSPRMQRKREKQGKLPLVEYKRMYLKVGVGKPRYVKHANDPSELTPGEPTGTHRRLHSVIGHFRTYTKGRDRPYATFVPQHWRGDPELGVLLRERRVRKD